MGDVYILELIFVVTVVRCFLLHVDNIIECLSDMTTCSLIAIVIFLLKLYQWINEQLFVLVCGTKFCLSLCFVTEKLELHTKCYTVRVAQSH